jgi:ADP-ribose pyrophosphatase YjhB (NUDIX family)
MKKWNKCGNDTHDYRSYSYNFNDACHDSAWFENVDGVDGYKSVDGYKKEVKYTEIKPYAIQGQYCNNCGKHGHLFSNCIVPITSLGIIACRKKASGSGGACIELNEKCHIIDAAVSVTLCRGEKYIKNEFEYLMIQRVESFGYIEFMRGKYSVHNYQYLKNIIDEMTIQEKQNLLKKDFDELWVSLWGEYSGLQYRGEKQISKNKYLQLISGVECGGIKCDLESLIASSTTKWETAEWGFPKGRRNHQEKDVDCAFREFTEETGYNKECLRHMYNILPYEEIFIGSNTKCYKNKYYICYMDSDLESAQTSGYQKSEVKNMKWLTYEECMNIIRPYNVEKKNMLTSINNTLHKFYICNI